MCLGSGEELPHPHLLREQHGLSRAANLFCQVSVCSEGTWEMPPASTPPGAEGLPGAAKHRQKPVQCVGEDGTQSSLLKGNQPAGFLGLLLCGCWDVLH